MIFISRKSKVFVAYFALNIILFVAGFLLRSTSEVLLNTWIFIRRRTKRGWEYSIWSWKGG